MTIVKMENVVVLIMYISRCAVFKDNSFNDHYKLW